MNNEQKSGGASETVDLHDVQEKLCHLVWENDNLREELKKNPKEVIERELGVKIRDDLNIGVIDQAQPKVYFILPTHPEHPRPQKLNEDELAQISGGSFLDSLFGGGGSSSSQTSIINATQGGITMNAQNVTIGTYTAYSNQTQTTHAKQDAVNTSVGLF